MIKKKDEIERSERRRETSEEGHARKENGSGNKIKRKR